MPYEANAGIISFVANLFNEKEEHMTASVANSQNMSLLQAALNPDPNPAKGGGDIAIVGGTSLLPETGPLGTLADIEEGHVTGEISIYVVRQGDSLSQIAKMFGVSVNTIVWANDISGGSIKEGQTLIILPISGVRHVARSGDTLASIAKNYKADLKEILQYNDLAEGAKLSVGDTIIIPDGEIPQKRVVTASNVRGTNVPNLSGYYARPIVGGRKTQGLHGYNGVDLASYQGAPVFAAAAGSVIISKNSGWNGGYGKYIVISHSNGTQTLYSHLSETISYEGKDVVQGEIIGLMGNTGKSTGPHLHFEIRGAKNPF